MGSPFEHTKDEKDAARVVSNTALRLKETRVTKGSTSKDIVGVGSWTESEARKKNSGVQGRFSQIQTTDLQISSSISKLKRSLPLERYLERHMKEDPWTSNSKA